MEAAAFRPACCRREARSGGPLEVRGKGETRQQRGKKKAKEGTVVHTKTVRRGNVEEKKTVEVDESTAKAPRGQSERTEEVREAFGNGNVF